MTLEDFRELEKDLSFHEKASQQLKQKMYSLMKAGDCKGACAAYRLINKAEEKFIMLADAFEEYANQN